MRVQSLDCCDRTFAEITLTVVVVFHDPGVVTKSPLYEHHSALCAHGHAQWELMGRSDKRGPRFGAMPKTFFHVQALVIDRHRDLAGGYTLESLNCTWIARFFDPDLITRVQQRPCGN